MQNNLEKYAAEAYSLLSKTAEDNAQTYAGTGFRYGIIGGAGAGVANKMYTWATRGTKPTLSGVASKSLASAALYGIAGGLVGGAKKRPQPQMEVMNNGFEGSY